MPHGCIFYVINAILTRNNNVKSSNLKVKIKENRYLGKAFRFSTPFQKNKAMKKTLFSFFILFISACTATKLIAPTQTDAERGSQKFHGYTLTDLEQGKAIYESHCNKCHKYKVPESRDETKWDKIIPVMAKKAKLDSTQEDLVLKYVVTMSEAKAK